MTIEIENDELPTVSRRGLLVKGGVAAVGLSALGTPAAAFGALSASKIKVLVCRLRFAPTCSHPASPRGKGAPASGS